MSTPHESSVHEPAPEHRPASRSVPRGVLVAVLVVVAVGAAGYLSRALGLAGYPYGGWAVPLGVALLGALTVWLAHRGGTSERVVIALVGVVVGALVGGGVADATPPGPRELERRLESMAGVAGLRVVSVRSSGNVRCSPCASAEAIVLTPASTVDEPLVVALRALREAGIATTLLASSTRPEEVTATGSGKHVRWSLRGQPETDDRGVLRERIAIRVQAG